MRFEPLRRLPDGTIKQISPFSGLQVWTVPGRGNRPLGVASGEPNRLDPLEEDRYCAFCSHRYLETPPEKDRVVRRDGAYAIVPPRDADHLWDEIAEFRRVPNLFEIVPFHYWVANYDYRVTYEQQARCAAYLSSPGGSAHVNRILYTKLSAAGMTESQWDALPDTERTELAEGFFASGHDVIVARRHYIDGATHDIEAAGSGTLRPDEHGAYIAFTIHALQDLFESNRYARFVAVFQNWLKPAGASFDHLHKQLVAIDERSSRTEVELEKLRLNQNAYNEFAVDYAAQRNLIVAENDHAIAYAGFGHRYPTLEVYSKSPACRPWEHTVAEQRAMSDLLHALHAATGVAVPTNEEWHYQAPDVDLAMPWRIMLKWRVSTLAGFEGGTQIQINTIDPWNLRDRVVPALRRLRERSQIADVAIGEECPAKPNSLKYNPALH